METVAYVCRQIYVGAVWGGGGGGGGVGSVPLTGQLTAYGG